MRDKAFTFTYWNVWTILALLAGCAAGLLIGYLMASALMERLG